MALALSQRMPEKSFVSSPRFGLLLFFMDASLTPE
jgi:hypothetical protein